MGILNLSKCWVCWTDISLTWQSKTCQSLESNVNSVTWRPEVQAVLQTQIMREVKLWRVDDTLRTSEETSWVATLEESCWRMISDLDARCFCICYLLWYLAHAFKRLKSAALNCLLGFLRGYQLDCVLQRDMPRFMVALMLAWMAPMGWGVSIELFLGRGQTRLFSMARCLFLYIAHLADRLYVPWVSELTQQRFVHSPRLERRQYVHEKKKRDVGSLWCFVPGSSSYGKFLEGQCHFMVSATSWEEPLFQTASLLSKSRTVLALSMTILDTANSDLRTARQQTWTITARIPWWLTRKMFIRTRNHRQGIIKLQDFFQEYNWSIESVAFGHLILVILFQMRCAILTATVNCIFNGSLSEGHGHSLHGPLWHLCSNYHVVDKMWNDPFLEEDGTLFVELHCDIPRVWGFGSLANSCCTVETIFLVCTKIYFITFQMFFILIHHASSEWAPNIPSRMKLFR